MCRPVTCKTCQKKSWAGCGMHVDQVMRGIPASLRCQGHASEPGLLARLLGRG